MLLKTIANLNLTNKYKIQDQVFTLQDKSHQSTKNLLRFYRKIILKVFLPLGEVAILLSAVDMLDNIVSASGKFGGVAGVLAGVINYIKIISVKTTQNFHKTE